MGTAEMLPWQPGDVILAADGWLYVRVAEHSSGRGQWPWHAGVEQVHPAGGPEGGTADGEVKRPVTLVIRGGQAVGGVVIDDRPIQGTVARDKLPPGPGSANA